MQTVGKEDVSFANTKVGINKHNINRGFIVYLFVVIPCFIAKL
jgi:hypothetical protein